MNEQVLLLISFLVHTNSYIL